MKFYVFLSLIALTSAYNLRSKRHENEQAHQQQQGDSLIGESHHQHAIQHEHAKSHQSINFHHYHPVPVYVKKEHSHLLKNPLEKGKSELELKQVHPETEHKIGGGLVLKDYRFDTEQFVNQQGYGGDHSDHAIPAQHYEHQPEYVHEEQQYQAPVQHGEAYKYY